MKTHFLLIMLFCLAGAALSLGCDSAEDSGGDGGDGNGGDTSDTGGGNLTCELDVLETFDTGIPQGWTIQGGGSGSGSGSGSGGTVDVNDDETWHHTTVETEDYPPDGMEGGYFFVGGFSGMNETLNTAAYPIGSCQSVSMMFTQYFDDFPSNDFDRGELWIMVDGPPPELVGTYNVAGLAETTVDLTPFLMGGASFSLQFVFLDEDGGNYGWGIDNVQVVGTE